MIHRRKMSAEEQRRALDYREGDIIQIKADGKEFSGRLGVIISIQLCTAIKPGSEGALSYRVKLSDTEGAALTANRIRLVRAAGSDVDLSEEQSRFVPKRNGRCFWKSVGRE